MKSVNFIFKDSGIFNLRLKFIQAHKYNLFSAGRQDMFQLQRYPEILSIEMKLTQNQSDITFFTFRNGL
ncbi:MAG: hypothetical protein EA359_06405 [Balneolaceae bacterium]|nr:MAG: hypothetical protein EA359_06405 [Balneolaceae bacterium]